MTEPVLVAGGGIGGLAAALALARQGVQVTLLEQASAFGEVGAGLQLGPNAVRVLQEWGLLGALRTCAAFPDEIRARDARSSRRLGRLRLGPAIEGRYGQPYATVHRVDLHSLLLEAVRVLPGVQLRLGQRVAAYEEQIDGVRLALEGAEVLHGQALLGCDGLWSRVRQQMLGAVPVRSSGHLAYRGLVPAGALPAGLAEPVVTVWLGPRLHVVHYPVRAGRFFNVVAVVEGVIGHGHGGEVGSDPQSWTHQAHAHDLRRALGPACDDLIRMIEAVHEWKLWPLNDRPPVAGPEEHARGRVALLGDAAHPLRPYLAQGAAMAIEDAWTIGRLVAREQDAGRQRIGWAGVFEAYARTRWARNARVQARSARNGRIFHADGLLRLGRNLSMALLGEHLMDNPWLYGGPPDPVSPPA
ncbi:MAG: FAD-dependent oxidoreductase [Burkholderiales bacterium]|nr:MAG: FAD-dependent oxidoreductase [Burkholderiales bacterium]